MIDHASILKTFQFNLRFFFKLFSFLFILSGILLEFNLRAGHFEAWLFFSAIPFVSYYFNRDIIRAALCFGAMAFLHEFLWFFEGNLVLSGLYTDNFRQIQIVVTFIILPLIFVPLYVHYSKIPIKKFLLAILVYTPYMGFWDLLGLPDSAFITDNPFQPYAVLLESISWCLIAILFFAFEFANRKKEVLENCQTIH